MTESSRISRSQPRYMRAYYHTFTPTGCDAVDAILEAIALAGKAYHCTDQWDEPSEYGNESSPCYWDLIQQAADKAASLTQSETGDTSSCAHDWSIPPGFPTRKCNKCGVIERIPSHA